MPLNGRLHCQSDSTYRGFLLIWQRAISVASNDILSYNMRVFVLQQFFEILWGFFIFFLMGFLRTRKFVFDLI